MLGSLRALRQIGCYRQFTRVPASREQLWNILQEAGKDINIPWMLIGDLNDISDADEKLGGRAARSFHLRRFANWISSCNLIDLGFSGPRFTWSNLRPGLGHVKERLDRALSNADWRLLFPEAIVQHLPRTYSDHCPLLVDLSGIPIPNPHLRPGAF